MFLVDPWVFQRAEFRNLCGGLCLVEVRVVRTLCWGELSFSLVEFLGVYYLPVVLLCLTRSECCVDIHIVQV